MCLCRVVRRRVTRWGRSSLFQRATTSPTLTSTCSGRTTITPVSGATSTSSTPRPCARSDSQRFSYSLHKHSPALNGNLFPVFTWFPARWSCVGGKSINETVFLCLFCRVCVYVCVVHDSGIGILLRYFKCSALSVCKIWQVVIFPPDSSDIGCVSSSILFLSAGAWGALPVKGHHGAAEDEPDFLWVRLGHHQKVHLCCLLPPSCQAQGTSCSLGFPQLICYASWQLVVADL